jgi:hypothetical protein
VAVRHHPRSHRRCSTSERRRPVVVVAVSGDQRRPSRKKGGRRSHCSVRLRRGWSPNPRSEISSAGTRSRGEPAPIVRSAARRPARGVRDSRRRPRPSGWRRAEPLHVGHLPLGLHRPAIRVGSGRNGQVNVLHEAFPAGQSTSTLKSQATIGRRPFVAHSRLPLPVGSTARMVSEIVRPARSCRGSGPPPRAVTRGW